MNVRELADFLKGELIETTKEKKETATISILSKDI